jgi:hypothetical protein
VLKVLSISENQRVKQSQSQMYRPISLNLQQRKVRRTRRLFCSSQISTDLFSSMLSYCKITMHRVVCLNLIPTITFFDFLFLLLGQVLPFLGLTTFSETQSTCTWMKRALTKLHGLPSACTELKRLFRSGSRKSGKYMVDNIINTG